MPKAILNIGYTEYVMDIEEAVMLAAALARGEIHESRWKSSEDGGPACHIYTDPKHSKVTITVVSDEYYALASLAGRPEK